MRTPTSRTVTATSLPLTRKGVIRKIRLTGQSANGDGQLLPGGVCPPQCLEAAELIRAVSRVGSTRTNRTHDQAKATPFFPKRPLEDSCRRNSMNGALRVQG